MTTEERVAYLEDKLNEVIELLRFLVMIDNGLSKDATDFFISSLEKINEKSI